MRRARACSPGPSLKRFATGANLILSPILPDNCQCACWANCWVFLMKMACGIPSSLPSIRIGNTDPEFTSHPVGLVDTDAYRLMPFRSPVSYELFAYAEEQARLHREHPSDDVISLLLRPKKDGEPLSDHEFKNFFTLLVAAGNDTTRYTMAAGLLALLEQPEQLAELREHLELMPTAVEEMLRWGTVTMHFRRTATQDRS